MIEFRAEQAEGISRESMLSADQGRDANGVVGTMY